MIKQVGQEGDLSGTEDETSGEVIIDIVDGEEIEFPEEPVYPEIEGGGDIVAESRQKYG